MLKTLLITSYLLAMSSLLIADDVAPVNIDFDIPVKGTRTDITFDTASINNPELLELTTDLLQHLGHFTEALYQLNAMSHQHDNLDTNNTTNMLSAVLESLNSLDDTELAEAAKWSILAQLRLPSDTPPLPYTDLTARMYADLNLNELDEAEFEATVGYTKAAVLDPETGTFLAPDNTKRYQNLLETAQFHAQLAMDYVDRINGFEEPCTHIEESFPDYFTRVSNFLQDTLGIDLGLH